MVATTAYHAGFVLLLVGTEAFFTALSVLNLRYGERTVRAESEWVEEELGVDDSEEMLDYNRATTGVSLLSTWVSLGVLLLVLYSGLFADAVSVVESLPVPPLAQGVAFVVGVLAANQLLSTPFDLLGTFVVEEIFGFNNQTPTLWLRDALLGFVVNALLLGALAAGVLWFVAAVPTYWPAAAWALVVAFSIAFMVLKPRVIDPLFNEFEPIEGGDLRAAVDDVFERAGFECDQIYEMDASRRSSHSNAYFVGFGRAKRVVLYDTLVEDMELDEIKSVLAHELAHWKRGHIWKFVALSAVQFAVVFAVLGAILGSGVVTEAFAIPATGAAYAELFVAVLAVAPVMRLSSPLNNHFSLAYEREADAFAVEVMGSEPMAGALRNLASENLSNPFPHPWYETFHYDHPPVPERLRYIRELGEGSDETGDVAPVDG